jgi:ribosomal protein S18 acetylase RimI-like enzyme
VIQSRELSTAGFVAEIDRLTAIYGAAMRADAAQLPGRRTIMERHTQHADFRAIVVTANAGVGTANAGVGTANAGVGTANAGGDSQIIGFGYGFRGAGGQWWHDVVRLAMTAQIGATVAAAWLDSSMEIAELHVHPDFQRRGIGRRLLLGLTAGRPEHTAALSTQDDNWPARLLYRSVGFTDMLTGFSFPGGGPPYTIMAAVLPLRLAAQAAGGPSGGRPDVTP